MVANHGNTNNASLRAKTGTGVLTPRAHDEWGTEDVGGYLTAKGKTTGWFYAVELFNDKNPARSQKKENLGRQQRPLHRSQVAQVKTSVCAPQYLLPSRVQLEALCAEGSREERHHPWVSQHVSSQPIQVL